MKITLNIITELRKDGVREDFDITEDSVTWGYLTTVEHFTDILHAMLSTFGNDYRLAHAKCEYDPDKKYYDTKIIMKKED